MLHQHLGQLGRDVDGGDREREPAVRPLQDLERVLGKVPGKVNQVEEAAEPLALEVLEWGRGGRDGMRERDR